MDKKEIISVSQYLDNLNTTLKGESGKIIGEVSGLHLHPSGHLYFSLLDKDDKSKIECVMWKSNYKMLGIKIENGLEVVATVTPNIYKPWGKFSGNVELIELVGEGALKSAYDKLKNKLESEGLFSLDRKRELPLYPHRIGVITSQSGAVIHDFNTNLGKFGFQVLFADSKVEGIEALKDLLLAIESMKKEDIDVLVIMRGGGSLESFQAFNNEILVKEVANFPVPVITGIGHDKDLPLVSMVSDKNVSTPTAVANMLNFGWNEALYKINVYEEKIFSNFNYIFEVFRRSEETVFRALDKIEGSIERIRASLDSSVKVLIFGFENMVSDLSVSLKNTEKLLELSDPKKRLTQGYSIIKNKNKIVKKVSDVKTGDELEVLLSDGSIDTQVI